MFNMRKIIFLTLLLCFNVFSMSENDEMDTPWDIYNEIEIKEYFYNLSIENRRELIISLQANKLAILSGNVTGSIDNLEKLYSIYKKTPLSIVIKRYLAIAYFTIGDFKKTSEVLSDKRFYHFSKYQDVCQLQILSKLHEGLNADLMFDIERCKEETDLYNNDKFAWLNFAIDAKKDRSRVSDATRAEMLRKLILVLKSEDQIESWLKYGIMYDKEEQVVESMNILPESIFTDDITRTILGYIYYNTQSYQNAKNFVEDIQNSNVSYLKAALETSEANYKTAHAHLMAAIKQKPFSINSNQLMTVIAYLTKDWDNGRVALNKLTAPFELKREQQIINIAYLVNEKKLERSARDMEMLKFEYNKKLPFEALILESYILFNLKNKRWKNSSDSACLRYDGMNCWLHMQSLIWPKYEDTYQALPDTKKYKITERLSSLTEYKSHDKINEAIFINQNDIIELDTVNDPSLTDENMY
jgi:hypothetical protein